MAPILRNMTACLQPIWKEGCAFHAPIHLNAFSIQWNIDFFEISKVYCELAKTKLHPKNKLWITFYYFITK